MTKFATALTAAMVSHSPRLLMPNREQQLPSCDSTEVRRVFSGIVRTKFRYDEQKDLRSGDEKEALVLRVFLWAKARDGLHGRQSVSTRPAFTIEWMNQSVRLDGGSKIRERQELPRHS